MEDLTGLKYQEAIKDVRRVIEPAEKRFRAIQPDFEKQETRVFRKHGRARAEQLVTQYTNSCLENVDDAYGELVDYLMFKYLYSYSNAAPPELTGVRAPAIPMLPVD